METTSTCSPMGNLGAVKQKTSQTEGQLVTINQRMSFLQERISILRDRLDPVLRCMDSAKNPETPKEELAPLPNSLRVIADDISYQINSIDDLIDRLEI